MYYDHIANEAEIEEMIQKLNDGFDALKLSGVAVGIYVLYTYEPGVLAVITPQVMIITAVAVLVFGILITLLCSYFSVNMFLKMKAGELYKI